MGSVYTWVYVHSAICATECGVVVFPRSMLDLRRGWSLSALVFVHSSICETYVSVVVLHRSMVNWRRGVGSCLHMGRCAFCYI